MKGGHGVDDPPLVSVVLPTADRPRLLGIALACYQAQTHPRSELIVVDDGAVAPVDEAAVAAVGGRVVRMAPGSALGTKLNRGLDHARGVFCLKMDDDDWYAPSFLQTMTSALLASWSVVCRPTLAFLAPFLWFDVGRWEIRRAVEGDVPGGTLLFARESWEDCPFRAVRCDEDVWFMMDQLKLGVTALPVRAPETFLAVRHTGSGTDRGHTWTHDREGQTLEEALATQPRYRRPEALLPAWALATYGELRRDILAGRAAGVHRS